MTKAKLDLSVMLTDWAALFAMLASRGGLR